MTNFSLKSYLQRCGRVLALVAVAVALTVGPAEAQRGDAVEEIVIEGTQRIEPDTVRSYMLIREGDPYDPVRVDRSLKSLFATGLFADVSLERRGNALVVIVIENPIINRIAFEGNRQIDDEDLEAEVQLRPRVIYTRQKVLADVQRVLTLYRRSGRFAATVVPKVIQLPQNRVDLVFEISEGDQTEIQKIRFVGNRAFSDGRLREVIRTRETRWYRIFTTDDRYDPDRLTLDRELLRRFYLGQGYADFRVMSALAELTPDRQDFFITFTVEEGERYRFGDVDVDIGLRDLTPGAITEAIEIEPQDWYNADAVEGTVDELTELVGTLGFAFVEVRPRINRNRVDRTIDVTFEVNEGPRVFVERIEILGNTRTVDKVIRREFRLVEGDAFNSSKLARSRQRIQNLGFFETVNVEQVPGTEPDKTIVQVEVEEKSTGSLTIGAGFSSTQGPLGDITIRERNLLGHGYDLRLSGTLAARRSQIDLSLTDPYFLGREISAGGDIFVIREDLQDTSSFDLDLAGFALRGSYPLSEQLRQGWKYTFERRNITDVDDDASRFIQDSEGESTLSQVSHSLTYDVRDSRFSPTEGYFVRLSNDLAGLGGSKRFVRNELNGATYYSVAEGWVVELSGSAGHILGLGEDIDIDDRFFVGGNDVRGFSRGGVGPRDVATDDALGGEWKYTGSVQLSFPIEAPAEIPLAGRVFTDFGSSGGIDASGPDIEDTGSFRASSGVGVSWLSPFGTIGIDAAFPWLKEDFDDTENFRVNFGTRF